MKWEGLYGSYPIPEKFQPVFLGHVDKLPKDEAHALIWAFYQWLAKAELYQSGKARKKKKKAATPEREGARATHSGGSIPTPSGDSKTTKD